MKKLEAYKQAKADFKFAAEVVNNLGETIKEIGIVEVSNSITVTRSSSDKQMIYAVGILNAQLQACKELGVDSTELESNKAKIIELRKLSNDYDSWKDYRDDIYSYAQDIYKLLDKDDLFALLEAPVKP